ncbi:MAG TPA: hypothetical protein PKU96_05015 [bacterium]|nr:hypothetical protein [Myxococcales bacterium]OQA62155.1 MAG: hypothetical protein BWY40_00194 [bacterium ADurb.Bin270]HPW45711.1 hypothetical protein [bacterium]HQG12758.1 hypothetical protein [bacterium]
MAACRRRDTYGCERYAATCVAPGFPAEFPEYRFIVFVGLLCSLGFSKVTQVAFGVNLLV